MTDAATIFRHLHDGPAPFRLVNAWDALSARVLAVAGAPAVATSSFAVAVARGYNDDEQIPWQDVCVTVESMTAAVDVPVSVDIEAGRGAEPVLRTAVADVVAAGGVGINLEDRDEEPGRLIDPDTQAERIAAARDAGGADLFINARCDVYFGAAIPDADRLEAALSRAQRYVAAGADGIFLPGLVDLDVIRRVTSDVSVPMNVMLWPGLPSVDELAAAGVRRISQGAAGFLSTIGYLERITKAYLDGEPIGFAGTDPPAVHLVPRLLYR
jgi:2-methylisocitrate lyase-like PEP mutase family enzyme